MKIVITGGSGFIGSNIAKLLKNQHKVTIFDIKQKNMDINFIQGNINDSKRVIDKLKDFDLVIHLAASLGVINTEENPVMTLDTNMGGTKNVLEACRINKIKKIIFSSSSEVYGEPVKIPIDENDKSIPITTYGISKLTAEEYIKVYSKNYGIQYTIFRLFNVYGDDQATDWVVAEFVSKAIANKSIVIHGDGSQIRAFCYVTDVAKAFEKALKKANGEIINVGNDSEPISIKKLAFKIVELSNSKSNIEFVSFKNSNRNREEIMKRVPSILKAKKILGYEPKISLEEGIKNVVNKFQNEQNINGKKD